MHCSRLTVCTPSYWICWEGGEVIQIFPQFPIQFFLFFWYSYRRGGYPHQNLREIPQKFFLQSQFSCDKVSTNSSSWKENIFPCGSSFNNQYRERENAPGKPWFFDYPSLFVNCAMKPPLLPSRPTNFFTFHIFQVNSNISFKRFFNTLVETFLTISIKN